MNWLHNLFAKIGHIFSSPKAVAVENQIAELTKEALPIVQMIGSLAPNKTVQEVIAAFEHYAVPISSQIAADPTSVGNAMLNLATAVLSKSHADAAVRVLNTAVQLALVASEVAA